MRPPPRIAKSMPVHVPRVREGMDRNHLANVRLCGCAVCDGVGRGAVQAHHLLRSGERGMSRKSSDKWALPLDLRCHALLHAAGDEDAFLSRHGIDGRALATALWAARGDVEAMKRVVFRARQAALLSGL